MTRRKNEKKKRRTPHAKPTTLSPSTTALYHWVLSSSDTFTHIIDHLDAKTAACVGRASKPWKQLADRPKLWRKHILSTWPDIEPVLFAMTETDNPVSQLNPKWLFADMWWSLHRLWTRPSSGGKKEDDKTRHVRVRSGEEQDEEVRLTKRFEGVFLRIQVNDEYGKTIACRTIPLSAAEQALSLFRPGHFVHLDVCDGAMGDCDGWTTTATLIDGHKGFVGLVMRSSNYGVVRCDGAECDDGYWREEIVAPAYNHSRLNPMFDGHVCCPLYSIDLIWEMKEEQMFEKYDLDMDGDDYCGHEHYVYTVRMWASVKPELVSRGHGSSYVMDFGTPLDLWAHLEDAIDGRDR